MDGWMEKLVIIPYLYINKSLCDFGLTEFFPK